MKIDSTIELNQNLSSEIKNIHNEILQKSNKLCLRKTNLNDLDNIYNLQLKCFSVSDQWYKYIISQYLDDGFIIETIDDKKIIGVLLQGNIILTKADIFIPITDKGKHLNISITDNLDKYYGIIMICVDPLYRGKGLAKKLICKHLNNNYNKTLYLTTRKSNTIANNLYIKMGYENIGYIKNKYFLPTEDSNIMMIDNK